MLALAAAHQGTILPQLGRHPWWAGSNPPHQDQQPSSIKNEEKIDENKEDWLEKLRRLLIEHPSAGLGECGLDKSSKGIAAAPWEGQLHVFHSQLRLAEELRRPVSVHCVHAFGAVFDALQVLKISVPVVLHAWTGTIETTARFLRLPNKNVYFSLGGHLTRVAPRKAIPMLQGLPLDRCLLESDAPDGVPSLSDDWVDALPVLAPLKIELELAPLKIELDLENGDCKPLLNSPASIRHMLTVVAAAMGRSEEEIAEATSRNARSVFCF